MAEGPPPPKRGRHSIPVMRVTAEERVKQFPEDLYSDDGVLFCKFCDHSIDYVRIDTIKDHMKSKKHTQRKDQKEAGSSATTHQQVTLTSMARSRDLREEFVIDFLKMATMADIPLEKVEKMKPFLLKYSKQAGTLPMAATLCSTYIPHLFGSKTAVARISSHSHPYNC